MLTESYLLPDDLSLADLESQLRTEYRFGAEPAGRWCLTYLDSFDWRIWQSQAELRHEESSHSSNLNWLDLNSPLKSYKSRSYEIPAFHQQVIPGSLKDRLASVLEMRALMPVLNIDQHHKVLRWLDDEYKTVARVVLISNYLVQKGKSGLELSPQVQLHSVKGYDEEYEQMKKALEAMGLVSAFNGLLDEGLKAIGRSQGDYSSKLNYFLDPDARSDATAKHIMLNLLNTIETNIKGTIANTDSEFLHDLRVATRRTRSAMTQIKGVFDEAELEPFKTGFAWIGSITGPTRDMDVYLLKFDDYRQSLPAKLRGDLTPFHDFLVAHHKSAQAALSRKMRSKQFRELIKSWRQWLEAPVGDKVDAPNAVRPVSKLSDERIYKLYRRVIKNGRAINDESPAESLHDLRKDCKKLRYLMEFFQSLYPKSDIRVLIRVIKDLLDVLGDFQDFQVQAESIEQFGETMQNEGAPARALMAMGVLVGDLLKLQQQTREHFAAQFADFDTQEHNQAFKRLFKVS